MSTKQPFDLVIIQIGYNHRFAMPRAAAMKFIEACACHDVYKLSTHWVSGSSNELHAELVDPDSMPTLQLVGPAQFHQALEAKRLYDAEQKAKDAA
jgi:hypothetical protein